MRGCLSIAIPVMILIATGIYSAFSHPTRDQATLRLLAAEAHQLLATTPLSPNEKSVALPAGKWPKTIADLKPYSVIVRAGMVDITTKPSFDGGWGYGVTNDKRNLTMLVECWSELGRDVYWHGPC